MFQNTKNLSNISTVLKSWRETLWSQPSDIPFDLIFVDWVFKAKIHSFWRSSHEVVVLFGFLLYFIKCHFHKNTPQNLQLKLKYLTPNFSGGVQGSLTSNSDFPIKFVWLLELTLFANLVSNFKILWGFSLKMDFFKLPISNFILLYFLVKCLRSVQSEFCAKPIY